MWMRRHRQGGQGVSDWHRVGHILFHHQVIIVRHLEALFRMSKSKVESVKLDQIWMNPRQIPYFSQGLPKCFAYIQKCHF